ncbi:PepSY-associated TM helix domain-containing protein [Bacillus sp. UNC41MFS5]|uniref:PepSY-associated TM helix domain-containing protein n=1 Tax=Bacillus sp. UNC41MFS5 TaxID=1449046 RepID=UPI00047E8F99|nr:PepSY-associated TM helix domain-containing protein [Bacillus sp. UNC41MFS5]
MKKTRKAHLWIGLICSIFILIESVTGLLMNEPWLIGQTQMEGNRGNFQPGQFNPGTMQQGATTDSNQAAGQTQGQAASGVQPQTQTNGQTQGQSGANANGQTGSNATSQFPGRPGTSGPGGEGGTGSVTSIIRGLHEGKIGTTNVKWLVDLVALAMIFLTGSGIYLSLKVLRADMMRKKRKEDGKVA